jgi:hypothetical protein
VQPRPIFSDLGETAKLVDVVKQRGASGGHHGEGHHGHHGRRLGRGRGDNGEWDWWPAYGYACPRYLWTAYGWRCVSYFRGYGRPVVIFGFGAGDR